MYLPKPLYTALPLIYFFGGAATLVFLFSPMGVLASLMLFIASFLIWNMRKEAEKERRKTSGLFRPIDVNKKDNK